MKYSGMLTTILLLLIIFSGAGNAYEVEYKVELVPEDNLAKVTLQIQNKMESSKSRAVKEISFNLQSELHSDIKGNGKLKVSKDRVTWLPPKGKAWLSLKVNLLHERGNGENNSKNKGKFDSFINEDWALFRGDDLFPSAKVVSVKNASATTLLKFELPKNWRYTNTAWTRNEDDGRGHKPEFIIDDPDRSFDRPTGWMIVGKIATRRDVLGETLVSISSSQRQSFKKEGPGLKRMEILTLLHFVWPQIQKLLPEQPQNLLVVGAGDPMWRGGLSAPNSLYVHADRPLISENGTSTLLHEVFHSLTRIRGKTNDDWIAEGLAEYYSVKLVHHAGGMSGERYDQVFSKLEARSKKVKTLRKKNSTGATTAKAALLFRELDREISNSTDGKYSLDDVVKKLVEKRSVGLGDLQETTKSLIGKKSKILDLVK